MKLIIWKDGNRSVIPADRLEREESVMFAYRNDKCIGMFDLGGLDMIYLSEDGKGDKPDNKHRKQPYDGKQGNQTRR